MAKSKRPRKVKWIYISFDLGIQGDYEGLYTWLARYDAKECGEGLATLRYPTTATEGASFLRKLESGLRGAVTFQDRARVYVIYRDFRSPHHIKGYWLIGERRRAPWAGYGATRAGGEDVST